MDEKAIVAKARHVMRLLTKKNRALNDHVLDLEFNRKFWKNLADSLRAENEGLKSNEATLRASAKYNYDKSVELDKENFELKFENGRLKDLIKGYEKADRRRFAENEGLKKSVVYFINRSDELRKEMELVIHKIREKTNFWEIV